MKKTIFTNEDSLFKAIDEQIVQDLLEEKAKPKWSTIFVLQSPFYLIWKSYCVMTLWNWFIIEYFHLAPINLLLAIGLILLVQIILIKNTVASFTAEVEKTTSKDIKIGLTASWVVPGLAVIIGSIIKNFI